MPATGQGPLGCGPTAPWVLMGKGTRAGPVDEAAAEGAAQRGLQPGTGWAVWLRSSAQLPGRLRQEDLLAKLSLSNQVRPQRDRDLAQCGAQGFNPSTGKIKIKEDPNLGLHSSCPPSRPAPWTLVSCHSRRTCSPRPSSPRQQRHATPGGGGAGSPHGWAQAEIRSLQPRHPRNEVVLQLPGSWGPSAVPRMPPPQAQFSASIWLSACLHLGHQNPLSAKVTPK